VPGAAHAGTTFEDDEVLDARPAQVDGQADPGEAASDDRAPRWLHERIAAGRAAGVGKLAQAPAGTPDPELAARMLSAYADEAAGVLGGQEVEPIVQPTRWALARLSAS
jgi:hypothetical protein